MEFTRSVRMRIIATGLCALFAAIAFAADPTDLDALQKQIDAAKVQSAKSKSDAAKAGAAQSSEGRSKATLVIRSDASCTLYVNGTRQQAIGGIDSTVNVKASAGDNLIDCVSTDEADASFSTTVKARVGENTVVVINLAQQVDGIRSAKAKVAEEKARQERLESRYELQGGTIVDRQTGLMWTASDNGAPVDWPEANNFCQGLGRNWRLPTMAELSGIYDASLSVACFPGYTCHASPKFHLTGLWYWSGDRIGSSGAWRFDLDSGNRYSRNIDHGDDYYRALCVRRS